MHAFWQSFVPGVPTAPCGNETFETRKPITIHGPSLEIQAIPPENLRVSSEPQIESMHSANFPNNLGPSREPQLHVAIQIKKKKRHKCWWRSVPFVIYSFLFAFSIEFLTKYLTVPNRHRVVLDLSQLSMVPVDTTDEHLPICTTRLCSHSSDRDHLPKEIGTEWRLPRCCLHET